MATFTNRLATETSPYLLQHAHNPVDWYPWGPEALETAREEGKPIFLSIGYAACHWCHVMEHESFEDEATAKVLNEHFVPIKVDREERPDLDAIYMDAVQAMTGQGGWPMSVFLTPDGKPFYGGTYFPNVRRYGMSSFLDVLESVSRAWREQREQVEGAGRQLVEAIGSRAGSPSATLDGTELDATLLDAAMLGLERSYDVQNGGWGGPPKFPQPMTLEFLLRLHTRTGDARPLAMARHTLDKMSAGGIYDHLGGGFARYATDSIWLVPHFEKMLYDNGQLARVYLHAYQLTGDARYGEVARETLDYLAREMVTTDGALAASQDADTEGEEGLTYVWTAGEIRGALDDEAPLFERAYGVTEGGNWEGATILSRVRSDEALAKDEGMTVEEVRTRLAYARRRLFEVRSRRPQPGRDDKALAAWNGLAIGPFAEAGRILGEQRYVAVGARAAEVLLSDLRTSDGGLMRSWKDGRATANGVLEDFADLADGLLALYEATFDERWFVAARELMEQVLDRFPDAGGGFFDTSRDHEALITRPKGLQDNATPAGNSVAATVLLRLAALTGEGRYRDHAEGALGLVLPVLGRYPTAFGQWLSALDFAIGPVKEVAIVGDPGDPATGALVDVALDGYQARRVVAVSPSASASDSAVPLSKDRPMLDGRPTAYVCEGFVCQRPVTEPEALREQLVPG